MERSMTMICEDCFIVRRSVNDASISMFTQALSSALL